MNTGNSIFKNTTYLIGGQFVSRIIRTILIIIIARQYGPEDYGQYSFAFALVISFILFADLGLINFITREVARKKEDFSSFITNTFILKSFYSVFTALTILGICFISQKSDQVVIIVSIILLASIIDSFILVLKAVLQAFEKMEYEAISGILKSLIITVFAVTLIYFELKLQIVVLAFLIGQVFEALYLIKIYKAKFGKIFSRPTLSHLPSLVKKALPFGWQQIFATFYTYADRSLISFIKGDEAVGYYDASYKTIVIATFIMMAFGKAVYPTFSRLYETSLISFNKLLKSIIKISVWVGIGFGILIFMNAKSIVLFLFGNQYLSACNSMKILAWAGLFLIINLVLGPIIRAMNRERFTAKVAVTAFFVNILANLFLIKRIGIEGAAISTLLTEFLVFVLYIKLLHQEFRTLISSLDFVKLSFCTSVFAFSSFIFKDISFGITIILLPGIFFVSLILTKYISATERKMFWEWLVPAADEY
ncbi:MAG: flippase [bacterium]